MSVGVLYQGRLKFGHNAILTRGMLKELRDFPRVILALHYQGFSSGICCGMTFAEKGGEIFATPGLVRLDEEFYILPQEVSLTGLAREARPNGVNVDRWSILLEPSDEITLDGAQYATMRMVVAAEGTGRGQTLELATFSNQLELQLPRQDEPNIYEQFTRRANLGLLNTLFAARGEPTFHPFVFAAVSDYLQKKKIKSQLDWQFLFLLLQDGWADMGAIRLYIHGKLERQVDLPVSTELFGIFCEALDALERVPERYAAASAPAQKQEKQAKRLAVINYDPDFEAEKSRR